MLYRVHLAINGIMTSRKKLLLLRNAKNYHFNVVNKEVDRVSPDIVYFLFIYLFIYSFNFLWIRDHGWDQEWHVVKLRQALLIKMQIIEIWITV